MDALPTRELTNLETAIQAFNAGADPSAGALQLAFLSGEVCVLSPSEIHPGGKIDSMLALDGGDGETYLQVFTHEDRVPLDVGQRYPWMVRISGARALDFTTTGITVNHGSDRSLAVAVKSGGVEEMRVLARARASAASARAARPANELETLIDGVDRAAGMDAIAILRFGSVLWPAVLAVPSSRPLDGDGPIDLDACYTFGPDDDRMLAVFTDRDQLGEFAAAHLLEIRGGELFHRLPGGTGMIFNPRRPDELALIGKGLQLMASLIERPAPGPGDAPVAEAAAAEALAAEAPAAKRGLFGRRR